MIEAENFAIIGVVALVLFVILQRRIIFSFSSIGVFFVVNFIIILAGILSFPLFPAAMSYGGARLWLLEPDDVANAIVLNLGGAMLIVVMYHVSHAVITGRMLSRGPNLLRAHLRPPLGFSGTRVLVACAAVLVYLALFVVRQRASIIAGIMDGLVGGNNVAMVAMRKAIGSEYLSILVIFDVAPFFGVALWLYARRRRDWLILAFAAIYVMAALAALVFTFQKRPALLFLLTLLIAEIWLRTYVFRRARRVRRPRAYAKKLRRLLVRRAGASAMVVFVCLMMLYHAHTMIARGSDSTERPPFWESTAILARVAFTSVIYGLSLPAIMQVHYFPEIEPFYGLRNLGPVSKIADIPRYENTVHVYEYFYGDSNGSIAVPALMDFYGAFGVPGWLAGIVILGVLFERIDAILSAVRPSAARTLMAVFVFVFAYYLSHASLANSLMGYGGAIFFILWLFISVRLPAPIARPSEAPMPIHAVTT